MLSAVYLPYCKVFVPGSDRAGSLRPHSLGTPQMTRQHDLVGEWFPGAKLLPRSQARQSSHNQTWGSANVIQTVTSKLERYCGPPRRVCAALLSRKGLSLK